MKEPKMKASILRTIMIISIFVIIGISIAGFYFFVQIITSEFPPEISSNSTGSGLTTNNTATSKANRLISSSQNYKDQVTNDLNKYASNAGISISNIDFTQQTALSTDMAISGVESKFAIITLTNPVTFTGLMKFLKSIENNLPKMQINGIDLKPASGSNGSVTVEPLTVKVYTR